MSASAPDPEDDAMCLQQQPRRWRLAAAALPLALACSRPTDLSRPVAGPDEVGATRGAAVTTGNVLANDQDPGGGTLTLTSFTQGTLGAVTSHGDGTFTWDPLASIGSGDDQFTYTVQNPQGVAATGTVTVHVAPSWSRPRALEQTTLARAADPLGNLTILLDRTGSGDGIAALRRDADHRWSAPARLDVDPPSLVSWPQLLTDAAGNATVLWSQGALWASRWTAATTAWSPPFPINAAGAAPEFQPIAVADAAGNVTVAWTGLSHLYEARLDAATGQWRPAALVDVAGGVAGQPQLVVDDSGNVTAAWTENDGIHPVAAWVSHRPADGPWGTPVLLTPDRLAGASPILLLAAGGGNAFAVASQYDPGGPKVWATWLYRGAWGTPYLLASNAGVPVMRTDGSGGAVVAWSVQDTASSTAQLWVDSFTDAGGWRGASRLDAAAAPGVMSWLLEVDGDGNAAAVWSQGDGTQERLFTARLARGGWSWSTRELTAEPSRLGCGQSLDLRRLHIDAGGNATVLWSQCDGALEHAWAAHYQRGSGLWTDSAKIELNEQHTLANLRSVMDPSGAVTVSLRLQEGGAVDRNYGVRMAPGGVWSAPVLLGSSTVQSNTPMLFATASGQVTAVWPSQSDPVLADLWVARWAQGSWQPAERLVPNREWIDCWEAQPGPGNAMTVFCDNGPALHWLVDWR